MFRFGILLILCVFVCVVSVFAHDPPAGEYILTLLYEGTETRRSWGDSQVTISEHTDVNDVHVHKYTVTYTAAEAGSDGTVSIWRSYGGKVRPHWHSFPAHQHDNYVSHVHGSEHVHANPSDTHNDPHDVDNDHSHVGTQQDWHSHALTHQHDEYAVHTHTTRHSHPDPSSVHGYHNRFTVSEVHERSQAPTTVHERSLIPPTPTRPTGIGDGTPVVEESGTPEGTSSPQPVVPVVTESPPQETPPEPPPMQPIRVTEYMVRDWAAGIGGLPQWIEVYNPNTEETVNLKGYTFQYATRRSANAPHKVHTLTLAGAEDGFSIAGGGVAILSTGKVSAWRFSGIGASQVYNLSIDNVLKRGWVLTDADGKEIHRLGRAAFSALGDPVAPLHQNKARVSHQVVPSESPPEVYYYGHREDMGSPGFYKQPAPAAPSAVKRKRVGTWASLKRTP